MTRTDIAYTAALLVVGGLLLANLLRPTSPAAFDLPAGPGTPVSISAAGDSAWAIAGNKVYYLTLRPRGEIANRSISQIAVQDLK